MKTIASIFFVLACSWLTAAPISESITRIDVPRAPSIQVRAGLGLPDFFSIQLAKRIDEIQWLGIGVGILPLSFALSTPVRWHLSDSYSLAGTPKIDILSSQLFYQVHPWGGTTYFRLQFSAVIVNLNQEVNLTNRETDQSTNLANLNIFAVQPILGASIGEVLWKPGAFRLEGGLGIGLLFPRTINLAITGGLPSYFSVVPEAAGSFKQGFDQATLDVTKTMNDLPELPRILPTFFLQGTW